jgi:hypothetical protein
MADGRYIRETITDMKMLRVMLRQFFERSTAMDGQEVRDSGPCSNSPKHVRDMLPHDLQLPSTQHYTDLLDIRPQKGPTRTQPVPYPKVYVIRKVRLYLAISHDGTCASFLMSCMPCM